MDAPKSPTGHDNKKNRQPSPHETEIPPDKLLALSRALHSLTVPGDLRAFARAAPEIQAPAADGQAIHPDAAELLGYFQRSGQDTDLLSKCKVRRAYIELLRIRRAAFAIDAAERERPGAIAKALGAMGRECDDAILIWLRLQRGEKGQGDRRCRRGYIPRTRRSVAIDRQRSDMAGAGTAMSHVADLRKRAIELLAGELGLSKGEVERLPLDAYRDGMIAIAEGRATIALARETCSAVRAWLGARHSRSGKLFPRLRSRQRREAVTLPSHERLAKTVTDRARDMRRLEVEDTLRLLWAGVKNNARALIFMRVSERRGWDPAFVESLAKGLPAALRTTCNLTRRQVRTAQREITAAWDRHPDKDEYRARGKFKGRQL